MSRDVRLMTVALGLMVCFAASAVIGQQTGNGAFSKVRIVSSAADALCVGGNGAAPASSTCVGGIYAGPIVSTGSSGVTSVNTTASSSARYSLGNDGGAAQATWIVYGTTHATRASQVWLGSEASYPVIVQTGGTERARFSTTGGLSLGVATDPGAGGMLLSGAYFPHCVTKTANYTTTTTDQCVDATSGTWTLTLHTAVGHTNQTMIATNNGSGVITLNTTSGELISGQISGAITLAQYDSLTMKSDNANWFIQ